MTRRALLIGAEAFGLTGVTHDVAAMAAALKKRGFTVRRCEGLDATRDGIIGAYETLIADTGHGDAALVYYSGHGGYAWPAAGENAKPADNTRQFIVPFDFREPTADDFRGITAVELSVLLGRLTEKTSNAVVVLDCCHSAMMSRDLGDAHVRQLPGVVRANLDAHHRRQIDAGLRIDLSDPTGNKNAVRVVACATEEYAHELPRRDGPGRYGVFTRALIQAWDEAGPHASWSQLIARIRHLVQLDIPHQRPGIEGPFERLLFEVDPADSAGWLFVTGAGAGRARIAGAALLGVQVGDRFAIMPASASGPADEGRLATVRIDEVELVAATGPLVFDGPDTTLPVDARAYRMTAVAPRIPVRVPAFLASAVDNSTFVRVAGPQEDTPVTVLESPDGALTVRDAIGPLHQPRLPDPATKARVVDDLNRIAKAIVVRSLREESRGTFAPPVTLQWGRVHGGTPEPLPQSGATIHTGDLVYVRIHNGAGRHVYASLFDIGVSYAITLLTDLDPAGVKVPGGEEYMFGAGWDSQLVGVQSSWPDGLDRGSPRPETVLALITSEPVDVSPLHQHGVRGKEGHSTPLSDLLAHFGAGADRDFRRPALFCVRTLEFTLDPVVRGSAA